MRKPQGYAVWTGATATREADTVTCCHCNAVVLLTAPLDQLGGHCRLCDKPVCAACAGKACVPFERRLEAIERRGRLLAAAGL